LCSVGAEHAAVSGFRPEYDSTAFAFMKKNASVEGHAELLLKLAVRTAQQAVEDRRVHQS
jgi:hypothetical protein